MAPSCRCRAVPDRRNEWVLQEGIPQHKKLLQQHRSWIVQSGRGRRILFLHGREDWARYFPRDFLSTRWRSTGGFSLRFKPVMRNYVSYRERETDPVTTSMTTTTSRVSRLNDTHHGRRQAQHLLRADLPDTSKSERLCCATSLALSTGIPPPLRLAFSPGAKSLNLARRRLIVRERSLQQRSGLLRTTA
jgi:hypothetical protein